MRKVLLDNLSLLRLPKKSSPINKNDIHFQNFIYSMVLWDKVACIKHNREYFFLNESDYLNEYDFLNNYDRSYGYAYKCNDKTFLSWIINLSLDGLGFEYIDVPYYEYGKVAELVLKNIQDYYLEECIASRIAKDAIRYILLGYNLGMNIFLSKERSEFIRINHYDKFQFNRLDTIILLEKKVEEFYEEINRKIGMKIICFRTPLFVDFICQNAINMKEVLELIKELKNNKQVIDYKKTMEKMENSLDNGNFVEFNEYLSVIPDIVDSICSSEIKTQSIEIGFNPIPSIGTCFDLVHDPKRNKKLHMRFLQDIAKFGLTERIMKL